MSDHEPPVNWPARLRLDPTAFIAPGAVVVGEVTLGARSSVWFNTVLRGDTAAIVIGDDSNVQDNSVVHMDEGLPALVGARVTVGHRAIVHGCVIEDDCLIGMGAIVLSGARIGTGSLIGAGALVREGQDIPPGSLAVGTPARVVGAVSAAHTDAIRRGTTHYVALSRSYLRRGMARPHPLPASAPGTSGVRGDPMSYAEWGRLLRILREGTAHASGHFERDAALWSRSPGASRWSAHEVVCHLAQVDMRIYQPRVVQLLAEPEPVFDDVDPTPWVAAAAAETPDPARLLATWQEARAALVSALSPLGPREWLRLSWHSLRGPYLLGHMVRDWVEHDLAHRAQIVRTLRALGGGPRA